MGHLVFFLCFPLCQNDNKFHSSFEMDMNMYAHTCKNILQQVVVKKKKKKSEVFLLEYFQFVQFHSSYPILYKETFLFTPLDNFQMKLALKINCLMN